MKRAVVLGSLMCLLWVAPLAAHAGARAGSPSIPLAQKAGQLALSASAFSPAALLAHGSRVVAGGSGTFGFQANHSSAYGHLGMVSGFLERAQLTGSGSAAVTKFRWLGSIYTSPATASSAFHDGLNRTAHLGAAQSCQSVVGASCDFVTYSTSRGANVRYAIFQINECVGELKASTANATFYTGHVSTIITIDSAILAAGSAALKRVCRGATYHPSAPSSGSSKPSATSAANCVLFRDNMWGFPQRTADLEEQWWTVLKEDYNGNYPPSKNGSTPSYTKTQFSDAQWDMNEIHVQLEDPTTKTGLIFHLVLLARLYGVTDINQPGPYPWAVNRIFNAMSYLDRASLEEYKTPGSGFADFHTAQQMLTESWDALKQLPCH